MPATSDAQGFVSLVVIGLGAALSYELPIYAARYLGREWELNQAWAAAFRDSNTSGILFVCAYMAIGFAAWIVPLALLLKHHRRLLSVAISPLYPVGYVFSTLADRLNGARLERAHLLDLYRKEFRGQFRSFHQFRRYVDRLGDDDGAVPPVGFSAVADPYEDALLLLGLNRATSKEALAKRFRDLMMRVHPDQAGPNDIARRLTEARRVIQARKGW